MLALGQSPETSQAPAGTCLRRSPLSLALFRCLSRGTEIWTQGLGSGDQLSSLPLLLPEDGLVKRRTVLYADYDRASESPMSALSLCGKSVSQVVRVVRKFDLDLDARVLYMSLSV